MSSTTRRSLLFALLPIPRRTYADRLYGAQRELHDAHNAWAEHLNAISEYSPDFRDQVRTHWLENGVSDKFRQLEEIVTRD